jgi:hypothetical protein
MGRVAAVQQDDDSKAKRSRGPVDEVGEAVGTLCLSKR